MASWIPAGVSLSLFYLSTHRFINLIDFFKEPRFVFTSLTAVSLFHGSELSPGNSSSISRRVGCRRQTGLQGADDTRVPPCRSQGCLVNFLPVSLRGSGEELVALTALLPSTTLFPPLMAFKTCSVPFGFQQLCDRVLGLQFLHSPCFGFPAEDSHWASV